ncbi:MAG: glycosyltransferase family 4 protein, partial [Anaerolineae bacterium]
QAGTWEDNALRRTRILYLTLGLSIGQPLGGAERAVIELVCQLDRSRFEPVVCAFWRYHTPIEEHWEAHLAERGIEVFFASDWHGRYSLASYRSGIRTILSRYRGEQLDLIHSHFQMGNLVALAVERPLQVSAILRTAHASKEWGDGKMAWVCRQSLTKWAFPLLFDAQIASSGTGAATINRYPGTRLAHRPALHVPNGVVIDRFRSCEPGTKVRQSLGLTADDVVVGNVGRLSPEKGHGILLQAAVTVLHRFPNARFVIIGDGALRPELKRQTAELGLNRAVIWMGARHDVEVLYKAMDVFVLPSLWEAFGIVIVESMASGVPVVAADLPGTRELIQPGETGWLAEPGNPAALAAAITDALARPEARSRVARAAFEQVVSSYSIEAVADQYERIYDRLIPLRTGSIEHQGGNKA